MSRYLLPIWALILSSCNIAVPSDQCAPSAGDQASWSQAMKINSRDAYRNYLAKYPSGCFASEAAQRMKKIVVKKPVAAIKPAKIAAFEAGGSY